MQAWGLRGQQDSSLEEAVEAGQWNSIKEEIHVVLHVLELY